jgi:hypothetical protein
VAGLPHIDEREELKIMPEWLWFLAIFATYIVLMRWVLPRLGVHT